jgi:phenylacetate-CoA ligase
MLFENDRQLLRESFGVPVINEYGASELGVIAFENENLNWLLNNLTLYTEVVDENGKTMDFGQEGDLVITSLDNKAHPFIRYKIGDVGVLNQPIRNDGQTLEKLTGRTNVFAVLPSGKKVPALSFYYVTKSVIDNNGNVKELKVVQEKINQFLIRYVAEQELNSFQKTSIKNAIEKYLEPGLELRFIWAQALKRTKRGKLMQFESQL